MAEISYLVTGVRVQTVPVESRERFALLHDDVGSALQALVKQAPTVHEAVLLTTCNRVELFVAIDNTESALAAIRQFWVQQCHVSLEEVMNHMFVYLSEDAIRHVFRLTSGLDSLIVGESQIMAQVKDAWQIAQKADVCPYYLDRLFNQAMAVGKRVRTLTGIEQKDASIGMAAVEYVRHREPWRLDGSVVVIGGGKVAELLLQSLQGIPGSLTLINRSLDRLAQLTSHYPVAGAGWDALPHLLATADLVFVATGAPHVVVDETSFTHRRDRGVDSRCWVLDLSVPRNVADDLLHRSDIELIQLDALGIEQRVALEEVTQLAEHAINEGCQAFEQWRSSLPVLPTLTRFRHKLEQLRQEQLAQLSHLPPEYQPVMDQFSRSLINKILHAPSVRLKQTRDAQPHLEQLFDLSS